MRYSQKTFLSWIVSEYDIAKKGSGALLAGGGSHERERRNLPELVFATERPEGFCERPAEALALSGLRVVAGLGRRAVLRLRPRSGRAANGC